MRRHVPVLGPRSTTKRWSKVRRKVLTATDAAALCAQSRYRSPADVYYEKVGKREPFAGNQRTRLGSLLEASILAEYQHRAGRKVKVNKALFFHPLWEYLAATPDGWWADDEGVLVEAKAVGRETASRDLGEPGSDWVPQEWLFQTQAQMLVMGAERCEIAVLVDVGDFRIYAVERNEAICDFILQRAHAMADRIRRRTAPPLDWNHPATPELVADVFRKVTEQRVMLYEEDAQVFDQWESLGQEIRQREDDRAILRAKLLASMGEAGVGRLPGRDVELVRCATAETVVPEHVRKASVSLRTRKVRS